MDRAELHAILDEVLAGREDPGLVVYWPRAPGVGVVASHPVCAVIDRDMAMATIYPLFHYGWKGRARDRVPADWFSVGGVYLGPGPDGVHPRFKVRSREEEL